MVAYELEAVGARKFDSAEDVAVLVVVAVAVAEVMIAGVSQCRFNVGFPTHDNSLLPAGVRKEQGCGFVDDDQDGCGIG